MMTPEERKAAAAEFRKSGLRTTAIPELPAPPPRTPIRGGFAALGLLNLILAPAVVFAVYFYAGASSGFRNPGMLIGLPALPFLALSAYCFEKSGVEFRTVLNRAGVAVAVSAGVALVVLIVWFVMSG